MNLYLNNTLLPNYSSFEEVPNPNISQNITLQGELRVDIVNNRRSWVITWENMKTADYAVVRAFYDRQFTTPSGTFTRFWCDELNLGTYVFITIGNRKMKLNNVLVDVVELTLQEQYGVS